MEEWKPLDDDRRYLVSSEGRVWICKHKTADGRTMHGRFMKCTTSKKDGYVRLNYKWQGKPCCKTLHRAVAELFVPNPEGKPEINHINGDKTDNRAENLEWCTASENQKHALATGLRKLNHPSHSKPVAVYSQTGELMAVYPSAAEASRTTWTSIYSIYRQCEGRTKKPLNGYLWRYLTT